MTTVQEAHEALKHLVPFMSTAQLRSLWHNAVRSEECQFFRDKMAELAAFVQAMPKVYEQDGKGDDAVVSLHYFAGGQANFWITERDLFPAEGGDPQQHQAYGVTDLGQGPELGYVSIAELLRNGAELDLYFTPRRLGDIKRAA